MRYHYTHSYLRFPVHKVTVELVGLGGTGSQVLNNLARMNQALIGLGHPGLHVRAWDNDFVTEANIGRQLFSHADLMLNKAVVLITRVNRFFGTEWEAMAEKYIGKQTSNIIITCVDTAKARITIANNLDSRRGKKEPTDEPYYWLDMGNLQSTGQCVLGTLKPSYPPADDKKGKRSLKHVVQQFPQMKSIVEENQGPSCSLAEALEKQDLFINSILAQFGCNLLWKLFKNAKINHSGCYVNLETLTVNPIKII